MVDIKEEWEKHKASKKEEEPISQDKTASRLKSLFGCREDVYSEAFLQKNGKKGFKLVEKEFSLDVIKEHLEGKKTLGVYQLNKDSLVKWGCLDFDLNTQEDFERAESLYNFLKEKSFHPALELSGGGEFKVHIWIFSDKLIPAKQMRLFLENICKDAKIQPHEIFPKQDEIEEEGFGNLVKLPLGIHPETKKYSEIFKTNLEFHFDNKDIIPEQIEIAQKLNVPFIELEKNNPSEFDNFFNFVLNNELPAGTTAENKKYQKIVGVNDNILKNEAIWFFKKGYTIEKLKEEIKPIYKKNKWNFSNLSGWFKKVGKNDKLTTINPGELAEWCKTYAPDLIKLLPKQETREENSLGKYVAQGKFGAYVKIDSVVDDILEQYSFKTIYGKKGEDVWCYDNSTGLWATNGREIIKTLTEELLGYMSKIKVVNEVFEKIKRLTAISREEFEKIPEELICLKNGVLNVKTKELLPFNPDYNFKSKLDLVFNKEADCPKIKQFFEETLYPEDTLVLQEWFGFHLFKRYFIKKAMILFGAKDTGKTIILNLLTKFIGEKNKAGISLHLITKNDKFTLSFLKDKLANIYDDLSFKDLSDAGGFKVACGGGYLSAEYKFGDSFEFLNYAKNTFATNKIPILDTEPDEAYYLRWLPIPCDSEVPEEEQDKFLIEKITTEQELSGLLNYSLEGLQRLFQNGKFSFNKSIVEIKDLMEKNSNHFVAFVQDCLIKKEDEEITKEEMFELYKNYATEKKLRMHTKTQLGRGLEKYAPFISAKREKERFWKGAGVNPNNTTLTTLLEKSRGIRDRDIKNKNITSYIDSYKVSDEASKVSYKDKNDTSNEKEIDFNKLDEVFK